MKFIWPEAARSELRMVDQESARRILRALTRYENRARVMSRPFQAIGKAISAFASETSA